MIYTDDFVWLHFPRCAGTKTYQLFEKYFSDDQRIVQDNVDPKGVDKFIFWHDSIADREARDKTFRLGDRVVVCPFRRLPSWLVSRYSYEYFRSPNLNHRAELLFEGKFLERSGSVASADTYAARYVSEAILQAGKVKFLRTEYFEHDFKAVFGEFLDVSIIPDSEFRIRVNESSKALPDGFKVELEESQELYDYCPYWKMVEGIAYG